MTNRASKLRNLVAAMTGSACLLGLGGAMAGEMSGNVIKVGILTDLTSINAHMSGKGTVEAVKLAAESFGNQINGAKIEILVADHQAKPELAAAIARKWYENDGVDVITDLANSAVAIAVQNLAKSLGKMDLVPGGVTESLIQENCSPLGIHWIFDTYSLATGTTKAVVEQGGKKWFFITADYAFGHSMQALATDVIKSLGGEVVGSAIVPQGTTDFSSYLVQAQASGADVVGLANAGPDFAASVKQASEFGLTKSGKRMVGTIIFIPEIDALGLEAAKGLLLTTNYYWDRDDESRAFATKMQARMGKDFVPTAPQASNYSAIMHYFKAVQAAGTDEPKAVMAKMRELPVNDFLARNAKIRPDGALVHDLILAEVKSPEESKRRWDYYKVLQVIPGEKAFRPLSQSKCPLVKGG
jgi:branched-chain amino acid transport system substrate-binding protein